MRTPYIDALARAFQAEVFGEATYRAMARLGRDPERRAKLEVLCRLETQTKERLRAALASAGATPRESRLASLLGKWVALALAPLPQRLELHLLQAALARTVPAFERFERAHAAVAPELSAHLAQHERAQLEFVRRELAGEVTTSLAPVSALLT